MRLVDEAKQWYKMFSIWAMSVALAIQGAWVMMPQELLSSLDPVLVKYTTIGLLVFGIFGRLVQQDSIKPPEPKEPPPAQGS